MLSNHRNSLHGIPKDGSNNLGVNSHWGGEVGDIRKNIVFADGHGSSAAASIALTPGKRETRILQHPDAVTGISRVSKPPDSVGRSVVLLHARIRAVAVFRRPRLLRHPVTKLHQCGANRAGAKRQFWSLVILTVLTVTSCAQAARAFPMGAKCRDIEKVNRALTVQSASAGAISEVEDKISRGRM